MNRFTSGYILSRAALLCLLLSVAGLSSSCSGADASVSPHRLAARAKYQLTSMVQGGQGRAGASEALPPAGYHLTFDDEFKTLDLSDSDGTGKKWYTHVVQCCLGDTSHPSSAGFMAGLSDPEGKRPYSLAPGGGLVISLQKTGGAWYSGVLSTVDNTGKGFSQKYGYFEMKAKFPSSKGTWPAFWLLNTATRVDNHVPAGEIDIVEGYMFAPNYINTTLHDWTPNAASLPHHLAKVADMSDGFHTYGMLWTAKTMTFYFDHSVIFETPTPEIMQQPYYPIIDLGLGGGWPTDETPQRSDMIVQYVRVYSQ